MDEEFTANESSAFDVGPWKRPMNQSQGDVEMGLRWFTLSMQHHRHGRKGQQIQSFWPGENLFRILYMIYMICIYVYGWTS